VQANTPSVQRHLVSKARQQGSSTQPWLSPEHRVAESFENRERTSYRHPGPGFWLGASASWLHADVLLCIRA